MHIVILSLTLDAAERIKTSLGDVADQYTTTTSWSDLAAFSLGNDCPDLAFVERAALSKVELSTLCNLMEPGRWPPVLLADSSETEAAAEAVVAMAQQLGRREPHYYQIGELRIDTRRKRATIGEQWIALPPIQYRLLLTLVKHAGEVIGCQELLRQVWGYETAETEARELVKVHIRQIRRRLGLDPVKNQYIHSVRGFGYMLASPDED